MKIKIISIIVVLFTAFMTTLLLIKKEPVTTIITVPKIYSIAKTDDTESIKISLLTNNPTSYIFNQEYINNASIHDDNVDNKLPIKVEDIVKTNEIYVYNEVEYEIINVMCKVLVESANFKEEISNAKLEISYSNTTSISLEIGSFNYMVNDYDNTDVSLSNLYATHGLINGVDTVTGLFIELANLSHENIKVLAINTISNDVFFDNYYLRDIEDDPMINQTPIEILLIDEYNHFKAHSMETQNILINTKSSKKLYVPMLYNSDIKYSYRFPVIVTYEINGVQEEYYIDDFPYINTSFFKPELESEFIKYEFKD